jgi:hypothetical protein
LRAPAGDQHVTPTHREGGLRRGRERHPIVVTNPITRAHINNQDPRAGQRQEVRNVLTPASIPFVAQPERLSEYLHQATCKVQRQQSRCSAMLSKP